MITPSVMPVGFLVLIVCLVEVETLMAGTVVCLDLDAGGTTDHLCGLGEVT